MTYFLAFIYAVTAALCLLDKDPAAPLFIVSCGILYGLARIEHRLRNMGQ